MKAIDLFGWFFGVCGIIVLGFCFYQIYKEDPLTVLIVPFIIACGCGLGFILHKLINRY